MEYNIAFFANRSDAGKQLANRLLYLAKHDVVVLGLPRGGVPVAFEVAQTLKCPLDIIIVRKLGVPSQPELAMGAIGEDDVRIIDSYITSLYRITDAELIAIEEKERTELMRRIQCFRGDLPRLSLKGKTVIIIDDGIATGSTARAACSIARAQGATHIVLAIPVAPPSTIAELRQDADEVVCLYTPESFLSIGLWYADFSQTSDNEVITLLHQAASEQAFARETAQGK